MSKKCFMCACVYIHVYVCFEHPIMKLDKYVQKFIIALKYTKSKHRLLQLICKKLQYLES